MNTQNQFEDIALFSKFFKNQLFLKLKNRNLLPTVSDYKSIRSNITQIGIEEFKRIQILLGKSNFNHVINSLNLKFPNETCIRVLGFGHAITEFLIAPLDLADKIKKKEVVRYGALANLIVCIFDHFLDTKQKKSRNILPHWILTIIFTEKYRFFLKIIMKFRSNESKIVIKLMSLYSKFLLQLPSPNRQLIVIKEIKKLIYELYKAGIVVSENKIKLRKDLAIKLKRQLPFVIMGITGWAFKPNFSTQNYQWHIDWMYQVGEFFGWIDDAADLLDDTKTRHPNRILARRGTFGGDHNSILQLISKIADQGKLIINEWKKNTLNSEEIPLDVKEILSSCVISWLGDSSFKLNL
ncbi:MAG: hypothetical protein ACW986_06650 [Promethearchaeota archaeon]|jgi:hypothetical protein